MPQQMPAHAAKLKELGLRIDPAALTDPSSDILGAIVSLGGCSASFVSKEGLIITNHHCAIGALQYNSTADQNLLKDGFLAKTRAEERSSGPVARVFVTRAMTDVTSKILDGIDAIQDDLSRYKRIEAKQKETVAACEKGRPGIRCGVAAFYDGAAYYQIEQLEIHDVRLVYTPSRGIGNFGGEIDNWRWPRHTGDFAFLRAYVGRDGQPADYSLDNVPFRPAQALVLAKEPTTQGDLVLVAGYPGRTALLKTKDEVLEALTWGYPRRQKYCEDYLEALEPVAGADKSVAIKATPLMRSLNNRLTNTKGQLDGLGKGGLAAQKEKMDADLRAWIDADARRKAAYEPALDELAKAQAERAAYREKDASLTELVELPRLVAAASAIVRMAEERPKPDADRHPDYQERNWKRLEQAQVALEKSYARALDRALLVRVLERMAREPDHDKSPALGIVLGKMPPTDDAIGKAADALYAKTAIEGTKSRVDLLQKASVSDVRHSRDPIIALAVALRPLLQAAEDRDHAYAGRMELLKPKYVEAVRAFVGHDVAPDANGTLRLTYGTVRGYRPTPDAPAYRPFTLLSEVVAKARDEEPFDAPPKLLEAARERKLGPYVDPVLGDVPVDFLADLHITGGNSGSATLNAKGQLVGLAFDGNFEAMASDWIFLPSLSRSIHVDLRYVLWVMDAVDGAHNVLREIGREPAFPPPQ